MGYSTRYHAASLMAVFAALLVGIVIGAGLGSEVVSDTRSSLESSLEGDLDEARNEADALAREAERLRSYADRSYPLVVDGRLRGRRVAIVGLGDASVTTTRAVEEALDPAGARLTAVAILREVPDRAALAQALGARKSAGRALLGTALGRSMAGSGRRATAAADAALSRVSGRLARIDAVVVVRADPEPGESLQQALAFESGLITGLNERGTVTVGAERFGQAESSVAWFDQIGVDSTVDNIDETTGQASLVFSLRGVSGDFGRKESASRLIPDLLTVASRAGE